jgi:Zn finger protein HypA/HybF involved in hydrogenase expression
MTVGDMRRLGIGRIQVECRDCLHVALLDASSLPDELAVADAAPDLSCSACGSKNIETAPGGS